MQGLGMRLALGFSVALGLAVALYLGLQWMDGRTAQAADRVETGAVGGAVPRAEPAWNPVLPRSFPRGEALMFVLAGPESELPDWTAPQARVAAGGVVHLQASPPLSMAQDGGVVESSWFWAGIRLPCARLDALSPAERAALLLVLATWGARNNLPPDRIQFEGFAAAPAELRGLLRWLP